MLKAQKRTAYFEGAVVTELDSIDKFDAINELICRAPILKKLRDNKKFINAVFNREKEKSTGFGHGVAVAHGKTEGVRKISIALGISKKGIEYLSSDGYPVHLLFLVASPPNMSQEYLKILAALMVVMRNNEFREELMTCHGENEIIVKLNDAFEKSYMNRCKL